LTLEKTPTDILLEARDIVAERERWCQGTLAVCHIAVEYESVLGGTRLHEVWNPIDPRDPAAEKWCSVGALNKAAGEVVECIEDYRHPLRRAFAFLTDAAISIIGEVKDYDPVVGCNDNSPEANGYDLEGDDHERVLEMYDRAIRLSKDA
jgi:hypothetical protein